ncbi:MAG TPA: DUF5752 family protein [Nitrospirota bacterium]
MNGIFEFKQCVTIIKSTGKKARNLREFRDALAAVSAGSVFHHTYQYLLKGHILEYTNDFSQWAGAGLEESSLAERLSNIDPYDFGDIETLRAELLRAVDDYLAGFPEPRGAMPGDEFFFNETITLVFQAGVRVRNLAEFLMAIKYIDASSLYYHFFDARRRYGGISNDFSQWFEVELEKKDLAEKLRFIDPFMHSLEGIRERIAAMVEEEVRQDMESAGVSP